jgi:hypothetical protein
MDCGDLFELFGVEGEGFGGKRRRSCERIE